MGWHAASRSSCEGAGRRRRERSRRSWRERGSSTCSASNKRPSVKGSERSKRPKRHFNARFAGCTSLVEAQLSIIALLLSCHTTPLSFFSLSHALLFLLAFVLYSFIAESKDPSSQK